MDSSHRIQPLGITPTTDRQTPRNEFGEVLAQAVNTGAGLASSLILGKPVLSAAVAAGAKVIPGGAAHVSAATSVVAGAPGTGIAAGVTGSGGGVTGQDSGMDLLEAQRALQSQGQQFNAAYLQLQDQMQRESREFNAVSNIMKVRHDSAKAAINNIH